MEGRNLKSTADERREQIYRRLMMPSKCINCPQGKKITQLCLNSQCKTSFRCSQTECKYCGDKVHENCYSMQLESIVKLFNKKAEKWTEALVNIFVKEEEMIDKIRENQETFIRKFFDFQLQKTGLSIIKRIYKNKDSNLLSGEKALQVLKRLQMRLDIDEDQEKNRIQKYNALLIKSVAQIETFRTEKFIHSETKSKQITIVKQAVQNKYAEIKSENVNKNPKQSQEKLEQITIKRKGQNQVTMQTAQKYNQEGNKYYQINQYEKAVECYRKAIELNPRNKIIHYNLGYTLDDMGKFEQAIESFYAAIKIDPNYASAYSYLGNVLRKSGKTSEALESYRTAIEIDQNDANAHNGIGSILDDNDQTEEAIESYRKAIKINPKDANICYNLGLVLEKVGKIKQAIESFRASSKINPNDADVQNRLGYTLQKVGKYDQSILRYHNAIELDSNVEEAYENLRNLLMKSRNKTREKLRSSVMFLERVLSEHPENKRAQKTVKVLRKELIKLQK